MRPDCINIYCRVAEPFVQRSIAWLNVTMLSKNEVEAVVSRVETQLSPVPCLEAFDR